MPSILKDLPGILFVAGKNFEYLGKQYTVGDEIDEIKQFPRLEVLVRTRHVVPIVETSDDLPFQFRHIVLTRARAEQKLANVALGRTVAHPAQAGTYVPGDHSVQVVLDYVDQHPDDQAVQTIYAAETAGQARPTLLTGLEDRGATAPNTVASFTMDQNSGAHPLTVVFTNTSTGRPRTFSWNFGDTTAAVTTTSPTHVFTVAGTFNVVLTATNPSGPHTVTHPVTVT